MRGTKCVLVFMIAVAILFSGSAFASVRNAFAVLLVDTGAAEFSPAMLAAAGELSRRVTSSPMQESCMSQGGCYVNLGNPQGITLNVCVEVAVA